MKATITINLDNAAFEGDLLGFELAEVLGNLARKIESYPRITEDQKWPIMDINGNRVGFFKILDVEKPKMESIENDY